MENIDKLAADVRSWFFKKFNQAILWVNFLRIECPSLRKAAGHLSHVQCLAAQFPIH